MATMMSDDFILEVSDGDEFKMWQGLVGPYYIPYVDGAGNLSWTNTGGLVNPQTVNVTGRGLTIVGIVESVEDLPETANEFDTYLVGSDEEYHAYIFSENEWTDVGLVGRGEKGDQGDPGEGVPTGGTTGQVLKKSSNANYDTEWGSVEALPTGGTTGQVLAKASGADYDAEWIDVEAGGGTVQSVNDVQPDQNGNITLTADDIETDNNQSIQDDLDDLSDAIGNVVHVGASAPSSADVKIWLDTDEPGMSGVSSVNGKTGTVVLDADDVGAMAEWELVWTNESPTSSFSSQTISIDLSDYSLLYIVFTPNSTSASTVRIGALARITDEVMVNSYINLSGTGGITLVFRYFSSTSSGVSFDSGQQKAVSSTSSATTANERCVPLYIYGIKGVVTA